MLMCNNAATLDMLLLLMHARQPTRMSFFSDHVASIAQMPPAIAVSTIASCLRVEPCRKVANTGDA